MSTYPLPELLRRWTQGSLTPEQAIGQMLQHLNDLHTQVTQLQQRIATPPATPEPPAPAPPPRGRRRKR